MLDVGGVVVVQAVEHGVAAVPEAAVSVAVGVLGRDDARDGVERRASGGVARRAGVDGALEAPDEGVPDVPLAAVMARAGIRR